MQQNTIKRFRRDLKLNLSKKLNTKVTKTYEELDVRIQAKNLGLL